MPRRLRDDSMVDVTELEELWDTAEDMVFAVGAIPGKIATSAAGAGATVVKNRIKSLAPKKTGALRRGIVRKAEKSRTKGKKVYDLTFDSKMNDTFQKRIKEPGKLGSTKTGKGYAYYPVSQDCGYLARGKDGGIVYKEGRHFMRQGAESTRLVAEEIMLQKLNEKLEIEWMKKTGSGG